MQTSSSASSNHCGGCVDNCVCQDGVEVPAPPDAEDRIALAGQADDDGLDDEGGAGEAVSTDAAGSSSAAAAGPRTPPTSPPSRPPWKARRIALDQDC